MDQQIHKRLEENAVEFGAVDDNVEETYSLTVGVIGEARAGKSVFLQTLTGLDHCWQSLFYGAYEWRGVTLFHNVSQMESGQVAVKISLRQPQELVDEVKRNIMMLDPDYLGADELVFQDIEFVDQDAFSDCVEPGDDEKARVLMNLTEIVEHFDEICGLFGSPPITLTEPKRMGSLLEMDNGKRPDDPEYRKFYHYLAVARVDVYCRFVVDIGKVRFMKVGSRIYHRYFLDKDKEYLWKLLQHCDAAVVVKRPVTGLRGWDYDLYQMLCHHFNTGSRVFYLLRSFDGVNIGAADCFKRDMISKNPAVGDCRIVDFRNRNALYNDFVIPMLRRIRGFDDA